GTYMRWENGLQVCFARRTASWINGALLSSLWTFPAAFIDANYAVVFGLGDRPTIAGNPDPFDKTLWLQAYPRTTSYCEFRLLVNDCSAVSGDSSIFDALAVGRWKGCWCAGPRNAVTASCPSNSTARPSPPPWTAKATC